MSNIYLLFKSDIKSFRIALIGFLLSISYAGFAQVTIGPGIGGTNICVNKWTGGSAPAFTTLGNITIREANTNDIPHPCGGTCNVLLYLNAPTGWEFSGTLPTVTHFNWATGGANDITSVVASYVSSTQLLLTIKVHGTAHHDEIRIANLQVEATTSTVTSAGFIYASGGSGINGITAGTTGVSGTGGTNFGNVSQVGGTTPTVSITPTPTYTMCPGASVTFSATATGTITTYQWFVNGVATATGNPFTTTTLASGNTVYCEVFASGCGATTLTATSPTTTVTVTGPGLISGNPSLCIGASNTLSDATSGGTWSSTASGIASVGSTGIATGVSAGTATISYYPGSGCAAILVVTVTALPPAPTISPATASICNGGSVTLTAAGTYYFDTILSQNFNSGLGTWTVDTIGSSNLIWGSQWKVDGDGYTNELGAYHSPDNSAFILANADTSGPTSTTSTHLYSPVFSLVGYTTATLSFEQFYNFNIDDVIAEVDISTDGGVTWGLLNDYWGATAGSFTAFATETVDLTPYLGMSNLMIEYNYTSSYGSSWAVDNINITGTNPITGPIWAPSTYLFSNSSLTTAYSGLSADPVYVHPTTVTVPTVVTYTATVTSSITGCSAYSTSTVTINPVPAAISGTPDVCIGSITALTDVTVGGTWSSTVTTIGSVDGSGNVTGVGSGTTTISYTSGLGCAATSIVTVAAVPGGITGTLSMCNGSSSTLSDAVPGGTWSSSSPGTASVGSATGIVTGASIGTAIITYATSPVCYVTTTVTVTAPPNNIIGSATACQGTSIITHETTTGGAWSSSNTAVGSIVATVVTPPSATVLGESAGTTTMTYALSATCYVTKTLTFVGSPAPITGPSIVCSGFSINLTDVTTGGTWSSGSPTIAGVGSTGIVTGGSVGTATISYQTAAGATVCGTATTNVTVTVAPTAIFGATSLCTGTTITLTDGTSGGTWSSTAPGIGSIDPTSGVVAGIAAGTTTISYTTICGSVTQIITVNSTPVAGAISGATSVCTGLTITLSNSTASGGAGTWSSSNTAAGTVDPISGIVYGVAAGTTMITFTETNAYCGSVITTMDVTVNVSPFAGAIAGFSSVCEGSTITLSDATASGGTGAWSSSNPGVGTIGSATGVVGGMTVGTTTISYTVTSAFCGSATTTMNVTVNVIPVAGAISGAASVCTGLCITLSNATASGGAGTWSSSNTAVGTVNASTGVACGVSSGTTTITYTETSASCGTAITTMNVTVNISPSAGAISGLNAVCVGSTITLNDLTASGGAGAWSSSNPGVGTIGSATGIVGGIAVGTTTITFTETSVFCGTATTTTNITVNVSPIAGTITGAASVCTGSCITLSNTTASGGTGTWSSSDVTVGTVGATTGVVCGVSPGTTTITYTETSASCGTAITTMNVTVNISPSAGVISGLNAVCVGSTITLNDPAASGGTGTWSSSNPGVGTIGSATGIVGGIAVGTTTITFTETSVFCGSVITTTNITVNVSPIAGTINGASSVCAGSCITLSNTTASGGTGTWSSSNTAVGTVNASTGVVCGVSPGTTMITYTETSASCGTAITTMNVTVNISPAAGVISGLNAVCVGSTITLNDFTASGGTGTWSSSNPGVGTIGSATGIVGGIAVGTTTITFTETSVFCGSVITTTNITVNVSPIAGTINGASSVCAGSCITLSNTTASGGTGTWSSSNTAVGTVNASTGVVCGVSPGTTMITYTETSASCGTAITTMNVTVNISPAAGVISGLTAVCVGSTITLNDFTASGGTGTWSSSNPGVGTIGSATGIVGGIAVGTTTITFTETSVFCGSVITTTNITVNVSPIAGTINGASSVCTGSCITLSNTTASGGTGTWSSSNTAVGTVNASTGVVCGVSPGTTMITYTETSASCGTAITTMNVTVNISPAAGVISGLTAVCAGATITLNDFTASGGTGTWSSSNPGVGTIGSATGIVGGIAAGTTTITFTETSVFCGSVITTTNITVNVAPVAGTINGPSAVCVGLTISLSDVTASGGAGTLSSSDITVGTVGSTTGVVYGVAAGTITITFTESNISCGSAITTMNVTVNANPTPITGITNVCVGLTTTLNSTPAGGTWGSSNIVDATVGSSSGIVTGLVPSTTTVITYTLGTGCINTTTITVNPNPAPITGTLNVCIGLTTALSSSPAGGTWLSSNSNAGIGSTGIVTGNTQGTSTITYELPTGCLDSATVTVNPNPGTITGIPSVCVGLATTLNSTPAGGTWSSASGNVSVGSSSGVVTGLLPSTTATVDYTLSTGCLASIIVTVNPLPSVITGTLNVCVGATTALTDAGGGTWSTTSINVLVGTSGLVTGEFAGTAIITYTLPTTCITTAIVTVNPLPAAITGTMNVCSGLTTTLSDATTPGTWTSSNTTVATVGSLTGVVTGRASVLVTSTDVITYTLPTGCYATAIVTVNPLPTAIGGIKTVCVNYTTALTDASTGGTWSSSNLPVGTVGSNSGIVTGIATGTTIITYTLPTGCTITTVVTVNPLPGTITGTLTVCPGLTTTLTDVPGGGTWGATVGTGSVTVTTTGGVVTGGTAGTATVTYTIGTGCYVTTTVTVNPLPTAILGTPASVCSGLTVTLSDLSGGGVWSSSASGIASVVGGTTGTVTGGVVGFVSTATITYTLPATGCYVTAVVTVDPLPTPILGTPTVCSGLTTSLSDAGGGTWSTTSGIITVNTITGLVTGGSVSLMGTATITYTLPTTCLITTTVTVNPLPTAILGTLSVCAGLTTTLSDAGGGTWTSGNLSVATVVLNTGVVTGGSAGTAIITYTLPTGCITTAIVTVNPLPGAILGNLAVCQGLTTPLSDVATPGTWSTISPAIASVSAGGVVTGDIIASVPDTTTVIYTLPTTCITTAVITVNPLPATIMGTNNVCSGLTITLSDATSGGTWLSSGAATVGGATGYVTGSTVGTSGGTATITYKLVATGCLTTTVISVDPLPAAITGTMNVCSGLTTALNDATPSGTWSSSAVGIAIVGLNSGIVTGESVSVTSVAIITYTIPSGCIATAVVTVNPLPVAISGIKQVCYGLTTDLSDASTGGTWSSNNTNAGIGSNTGIVTGNNVGTSIITYTLPTGCIITTVVTVNPLPAGITGTLNVCVGFTTLLSDASAGGTWSSSVPGIGTVGSVSGIVGGIAPGTTKVTYTLPTGCLTSVTVTVNPQPAQITGPTSVCHGLTINLSDVTPGGIWSSSFPSIGSVGSTGVVTGTGVGNTIITYSLAAGCISTHVVTVNPLPAIYNVSGGGTYCEGGAGVPIYLSGSNVGISYLLFYDTSLSATGYLAGTGSPLNFGLLTVAGTYTVLATDNTTGCISDMLGSAFVIITPTVTPTVSIIATPGETVCPGTTVTLNPLPFYGGPSPSYVWSVNGVVVSVGNSYTYIPANGDIVSVKMTSDSACASPLTATGKIIMNVIPDAAPLVSIAIDPGDTTCQYATATFTATPTFGGTTPIYIWYLNGVVAGGPGPIFSYYPTTGDVVYCKMVSNYQCRTSDTGFSNVAVMTVSPMIVPHVSIASTQGFNISVGEYDTLIATATNAGPHPGYQWELNGVPIIGATSSIYISQFTNYDSITCMVTSSGVCDGISTFDWIYISVYPEGVQQYTFGSGDIRLMPNPNTGTFTVKGTLGVLTDEEISLEVTDMIGQTVYSRKAMVQNGKLNEQIQLGSKLANGMYLLNLKSGSDNKVFHFVIEQ